MKKIVLLIFCLFISSSVQALSMKMVCPSSVSTDEEFQVSIYVNQKEDIDISAIQGFLIYNHNELLLKNYDLKLASWTRLSSNDLFSFGNMTFDNLIVNNNTLVFDVHFKVITSNDISLSIEDILATDEDGEEITNINDINCNIDVLSNINYLDNISLSNGKLDLPFDKNVLVYNTSVDTDTITINYTKTDDKSSVDCQCENINLNYGNNIITLLVRAENGIEREYIINITRVDNRPKTLENNNNLHNIELSVGTISFDKDITSYDVSVSSNTKQIIIKSSLDSNNAQYIDWEKEKIVQLNYGLNKFSISVKAQNGDIKVYQLNITRIDDRDTDATLSDITISKGKLDFSPSVLEYVINVSDDASKIDILPKLNSKKSKYEITGPNELSFGDNNYQIKVIAENGNIKIYKLNIIRNNPSRELSNIALLSSLNIKGYNIKFDSNTFEYEIHSNEEKFVITVTVIGNGSYYILNDGKIDNKNRLIVRVTAEDGTVNNYTIHVINDENKLKIVPIIIIPILLLIGIVCFIFIGKQKSTLWK